MAITHPHQEPQANRTILQSVLAELSDEEEDSGIS